jgi:L-threonylcarbamoyladenylate synthase
LPGRSRSGFRRTRSRCGLLEASGPAARGAQREPVESLSPTTAQHVIQSLPDVPLVLDGGPCAWGIESTVLDVTSSPPRLLRAGCVEPRVLRDAIGPVALPFRRCRRRGRPVLTPGMSRRHYAPRAAVVLVADAATRLTGPVGTLTYEGSDGPLREVLSPDPREYAADLYAALHRLDDAGSPRSWCRSRRTRRTGWRPGPPDAAPPRVAAPRDLGVVVAPYGRA